MSQSVTVAYGSFSLTVNGYDDPFKVIREVTELCARISVQYPGFGAEPMKTELTNPDQGPIAEMGEDTEAEPAIEEAAPQAMNIQPLKLEKPLPRYRRIDLSQIRAAAEPLRVSEMHEASPTIRRFPSKNEN